MARSQFDLQYYRRFYLDPKTRVDDREHHARLVNGVVSMIEWFGGPLTNVLDVGVGIGRWGRWLRKHRPEVEVVSTELDPEVCAKYGHLRRDVSRWHDRRRYDLVVCQGVLPYLDDAAAEQAIENLAAMSGGFLYLEAITRKDLRECCDLSRTDTAIHARTGAWYRQRLRPHYQFVGAGLWYVRDGELPFYQLEAGT